MEVFQGVFLRAEPQVVVFVEPDGQGVEVRHQEPLTNVELRVVDQERTLCKIRVSQAKMSPLPG